MAKRSNIIVIIGLAVFVAGAAATFLIVRNDDGSGSSSNGATILVAQQPIPSGTSGGDAVTKGLVKTKNVDRDSKPANALTDPSQLVGQSAAASIPKGAVLRVDQFAAPQTSLGGLPKLPDGKTALALQLGWVQGVGGFVGRGDRIDIFGVAKDGPGGPSAKLIMQNTEVLNVNVSAQTVGQTNTDAKPVFVLAVTPQEAERLVYLTTFQELYFSLVSKDSPAAAPTPGSGAADALKQLS